MSIKSRLGSFFKSLAAIPARVGKFLLPGRKSAEKGRRSARMIVVLYLLIIAAIIGAYSLRGPLGEILIRADPFPFNLEEGEENGEEAVDGKDSPFTDVFAPGGSSDEDPEGADDEEAKEGEDGDALPVFSPASPLLWPVDGAVLVKHGEMFRVENQYRAHIGIDIEAKEGAKVKAAWHGTVKETGHSMLLGQYVLVNHGDEYLTYYANLGSISVREGAVVKVGDELGTVGSSAVVDASHGNYLHFAIYLVDRDGETREEVPLDPLEFLNQR
jgi:murein DD-endopeptidase MepM/ murein hydrolase activator NlpD